MLRAPGAAHARSDEDCRGYRLQKPHRHALREAVNEHHDAYAGTRRLPLRAGHHRHAEQDRGRTGSAPRLHRKAQARLQGTLTMDLQLKDKTAMVTGASMGIGRAIAKMLA